MLDRRRPNRTFEPPGDVRTRHGLAVSPRQQRRVCSKLRVHAQPLTHLASSCLPQRQRALLSPLAMQPDARCRAEDDVGHPNADDLRHPRAGIEHQRQQQVIALAKPGRGRHVDDCEHARVSGSRPSCGRIASSARPRARSMTLRLAISRRAANFRNERSAARRTLRLRGELPRSCSR